MKIINKSEKLKKIIILIGLLNLKLIKRISNKVKQKMLLFSQFLEQSFLPYKINLFYILFSKQFSIMWDQWIISIEPKIHIKEK